MKDLSSPELISRIKTLVAQERAATFSLIQHLEEVQARRLYATLGYASMWEFATQELGLSEGAAQRRIQAMRLVKDVPQAKTALETGTLSLSNAAKLQSFRQAEKKLGRPANTEKLASVVGQIEGLSQRDCEKKLFEISPEVLQRERERIVSATEERELKIVVSAELYDKLQRLRGLLAHAKTDPTYAELLEHMADTALSALQKKKGLNLNPEQAATAAAIVEEKRPLPVGKRVYLPVALKRAVWARGKGRCEITNEGKRCTARHRLEIDHITPLARGGSNALMNLRLACWHHNQERAREKLGRPKQAS